MSKDCVSSYIQLGGKKVWVSFKESLAKWLRKKKVNTLIFKGVSFALPYEITIVNLRFKIREPGEEG